jgi:hypothetical protein
MAATVSGVDILHVIPYKDTSHLVYTRDGLIIHLNPFEGSVLSAAHLPTTEEVQEKIKTKR